MVRPPQLLLLRTGECWDLEEQATEMLRHQRRQLAAQSKPTRKRGSTGHLGRPIRFHYTDHNDWLDVDQLSLREEREVSVSPLLIGQYNTFFNGQYSRAWADLPKRPSIKRLTGYMDPWHQFLWEWYDNWSYTPGYFFRGGSK